MDYSLSIENLTNTTATVRVTAINATAAATLDLDVSAGGTSAYSATVSDPGLNPAESVTEGVTGLTANTTYTVTLKNNGTDVADSITFKTKKATYNDPRTATEEQWEDLANRVNAKIEVGSVLSTPTSVDYVSTNNIQDGAVTTAKLAHYAGTYSLGRYAFSGRTRDVNNCLNFFIPTPMPFSPGATVTFTPQDNYGLEVFQGDGTALVSSSSATNSLIDHIVCNAQYGLVPGISVTVYFKSTVVMPHNYAVTVDGEGATITVS